MNTGYVYRLIAKSRTTWPSWVLVARYCEVPEGLKSEEFRIPTGMSHAHMVEHSGRRVLPSIGPISIKIVWIWKVTRCSATSQAPPNAESPLNDIRDQHTVPRQILEAIHASCHLCAWPSITWVRMRMLKRCVWRESKSIKYHPQSQPVHCLYRRAIIPELTLRVNS